MLRRAFSLIEVIVVMGIMAVLVGVTGLSLMDRVRGSGTRGMAYTVASELRAARAEAQRSGSLTAVCLPTDGRNAPVSRSYLLRKGDEQGVPGKQKVFEKDFGAGIFIGTWPGSALDPVMDAPSGWLTKSSDNYAVFFRPDGTCFTNGLPLVNERLPVVVAAGVRSKAGMGGFFEPLAITDPYTIWVDRAGTVTVEEHKVPGTPLPRANEDLQFAAVPDYREDRDNAPQFGVLGFLPDKNPGLSKVGLGQTYIEIHPEQKEGDNLEYGLATLSVEATDRDGGPLFFRTRSTASDGKDGRWTLSESKGRMSFLNGKWRAAVSWRPPPGAPTDTEYEFEVVVSDKEGHEVAATSGAGLLPSLLALVPSRLAVQSTDDKVYVANLEGGDMVKTTPPAGNDHDPFWSPDGTKLYTFSAEPGQTILNIQNADGTGRKALKNVPADKESLRFDPLMVYASYTHSPWTMSVTWTETTTDSEGNTSTQSFTVTRSVMTIEVLHLASGKSWPITTGAMGNLKWDSVERFGFTYPRAKAVDPPAAPGIVDEVVKARLEGYPPTAVPATIGNPPEGMTYNLRDPQWWARYDKSAHEIYLENTSGVHETLATGVKLVGLPEWSANGQGITYLVEGSSTSYSIFVHNLFDSGMTRVTADPEAILEGGNLSSPRLSPQGNHVYFLNGGHLWRMEAKPDGAKVKLSAKLPGVRSFALTR